MYIRNILCTLCGSLICSCVLLPHCIHAFDWDNDQFPVAHTHQETGTDLGDMHGPGPETPVLASGGSDYSAGWGWGQIHRSGRLCMCTKLVALNATRNNWRGLVSSACGKDWSYVLDLQCPHYSIIQTRGAGAVNSPTSACPHTVYMYHVYHGSDFFQVTDRHVQCACPAGPKIALHF